MSVWDEIGADSGDYVKFDKIGDTVVGTITSLGVKTWDDGSKAPQLGLDTDEGPKTLTAGQVRLKLALAEQRPEVGDRIRVELTDVEKRQGGRTLKHFRVDVQRAGGTPAPATAVAAPATASGFSDTPPF
jgi:hypothetical protein